MRKDRSPAAIWAHRTRLQRLRDQIQQLQELLEKMSQYPPDEEEDNEKAAE